MLALHEIFPDASLYTSVYDEKGAPWAKVFPKIYTSFLQKVPFAKRWHEGFGWLMPIAFETFRFDEYDLVISITSEAAKGIITKPGTFHLCYTLTPTRYLWSHYDLYFRNFILKFFSGPVVGYLRKWDKIAAQRPDKLIAISTGVQRRIKKYYGRDSEIIFPPLIKFETLNSKSETNTKYKILDTKYYLVVSRLVPYKRVDLVVDLFNKLGKKLVVVGTGRQRFGANKNIKFIGEVIDEELAKIYSGARALIMPQEEDFGIVAVEAQSFGVPVIAYKKGGALDTVIDGVTGIFFNKQNEESLRAAIEKFEKMRFNDKLLTRNAGRFIQRSPFRAYFGRWRRDATLAKVA